MISEELKAENNNLKAELHTLHDLLERLGAYLYSKDTQSCYTYANQRLCDFFAIAPSDVVGKDDRSFLTLESAEQLRTIDFAVLNSGQSQSGQISMVSIATGKQSTCVVAESPIYDGLGALVGISGFAVDVSFLVQRTIDSESILRALLESHNDPVLLLADSGFIDCNQAVLRLFGSENKREFLQQNPLEAVSLANTSRKPKAISLPELIQQTVESGHYRTEWIVHRRHLGDQVLVEVDMDRFRLAGGSGLMILMRDPSERERLNENITRLGLFDALTQLPSRILLEDRLSQALIQHRRSKRHGGVVCIGLDDLKSLIDQYGPQAGDQLLKEVAQRLVDYLRTQDTVARPRSDEFVAVLFGLDETWDVAKTQALHVVEQVRRVIDQPYFLAMTGADGTTNHVECKCTASLGVTLFEPTATSGDDLLKQARHALFQAKATGRNHAYFYNQDSGL